MTMIDGGDDNCDEDSHAASHDSPARTYVQSQEPAAVPANEINSPWLPQGRAEMRGRRRRQQDDDSFHNDVSTNGGRDIPIHEWQE